MVLCVPAVDKKRYYSVQLADMYSYNVGYMGSRATGNAAGCYMVSGPAQKGATPAGIRKVFPSETQFMLAIYRTQLFDAAGMPAVKKVQAGRGHLPAGARRQRGQPLDGSKANYTMTFPARGCRP